MPKYHHFLLKLYLVVSIAEMTRCWPFNRVRKGDLVKHRDEIRDADVENAFVIEKNGNATRFIGTYKGVTVSGVNLDGAYILHNHPKVNGILSFGEDDFIIIRSNPTAFFELCNSEYDYSCHVVSDMSKMTYNQALIGALQKSFENPDEDQQHLIMEYLMECGYIEYERRKKQTS